MNGTDSIFGQFGSISYEIFCVDEAAWVFVLAEKSAGLVESWSSGRFSDHVCCSLLFPIHSSAVVWEMGASGMHKLLTYSHAGLAYVCFMGLQASTGSDLLGMAQFPLNAIDFEEPLQDDRASQAGSVDVSIYLPH